MKKRFFILITGVFLCFCLSGQNNLIPSTEDCSSTRPSFSFDISPRWSSTRNDINNGCTPLAADLDSDGVTEVLALTTSYNLIIFNGETGEEKGIINSIATYPTPMTICDVEGDGYAEILAVKGTSVTLYEITSRSTTNITYGVRWTKTIASLSGFYNVQPFTADLDGDGYPEFILGNSILDRFGNEKATLPLGARGLFNISYPYAVDLDNDSIPEVVMGTDVYKYKPNTADGYELWRRCPGFTTSVEGTNIAADINVDGTVDLVYHDNESNTGGVGIRSGQIIVWTPLTNTIIATIPNLNTVSRGRSYTVVGDIDGQIINGKKYPEICFNGYNMLYAYKFDGTSFSPKWQLPTNENSGLATFTFFDFNLDGIVELVYRDETKLHIYDGSADAEPTEKYWQSCISWTGMETPIVADVTGDGSANIVVTGSNKVHVFEGGASKWASCPNVWNQQLYSPLLINRDLTVISPVVSPAWERENCDNDTVRLYNGGPMQVPFVSAETFCSIDLAPDVYIIDGSITTSSSLVTITVTVGNMGMAVAPSTIPITYYKNSISPANIIGSETLGVELRPGETTVITKIINGLSPMPTQFQIRLLDDGVDFPASGAFSDCDLSNNIKTFGMIEISKVIDNNTACTNSVKVFTVNLSNHELTDRSDIIVIDSLGYGWEFISATASSGTTVGTYNPVNRQVSWTIPSLPSGSSVQLLLVARATIAGTLRNISWVEQVDNIAQDRTERAAYAVVSAGAPPDAPVITYTGTLCSPTPQVTLTASGSGTFQWFRNDSPVLGATSSTYVTNVGGNFKVTLSDGTCTSDLSSALVLSSEDCIEANNDYITTLQNTVVVIDVLSNDDLEGCSSVQPQIVSNPVNGTILRIGNNIQYTPSPGFIGIDSLSYRIDCNGTYATANVYIAVVKPVSYQYTSCPDAVISIGMEHLSVIEFYWYDIFNGASPIRNTPQDTIMIIKNNTGTQLYYVEPTYNGNAFPRFEIPVFMSDNCGETDPSGCVAKGTLLFREDFGGNETENQRVSPTGLPAGVTDFGFSGINNDGPYTSDNNYWLLKYNINKSGGYSLAQDIWHTGLSDHTNPQDTTRGYMFMADADMRQTKFYEYNVDGICEGSQIYFSVWVSNLVLFESYSLGINGDPDLKFEVYDNTNSLIGTFVTGKIPRDNNEKQKWILYGFPFDVPEGVTSVKLKISNNSPDSQGNDFLMDDIEIRLCAPLVEVTEPATDVNVICAGTAITLSGNFTDDGTFGDNLSYRWEFSTTGDIETPSAWSVVAGSEGTTSSGTVSSSFTISDCSLSNEGFYRLVVSNPAAIDQPGCRAASEIVSFIINHTPQFNIRTDTTVCTNHMDLRHLVSDISSGTIIKFYKDAGAVQQLTSHNVAIVSDTVYYARGENNTTGCATVCIPINITLQDNPEVDPITGDNTVCKNSNLTLTSSTPGGTWNVSDPSIARIISTSSGSVTLKGVSEGYCYISYTVGNWCQTTVTFRLKVILEDLPEIIIGF